MNILDNKPNILNIHNRMNRVTTSMYCQLLVGRLNVAGCYTNSWAGLRCTVGTSSLMIDRLARIVDYIVYMFNFDGRHSPT